MVDLRAGDDSAEYVEILTQLLFGADAGISLRNIAVRAIGEEKSISQRNNNGKTRYSCFTRHPLTIQSLEHARSNNDLRSLEVLLGEAFVLLFRLVLKDVSTQTREPTGSRLHKLPRKHVAEVAETLIAFEKIDKSELPNRMRLAHLNLTLDPDKVEQTKVTVADSLDEKAMSSTRSFFIDGNGRGLVVLLGRSFASLAMRYRMKRPSHHGQHANSDVVNISNSLPVSMDYLSELAQTQHEVAHHLRHPVKLEESVQRTLTRVNAILLQTLEHAGKSIGDSNTKLVQGHK